MKCIQPSGRELTTESLEATRNSSFMDLACLGVLVPQDHTLNIKSYMLYVKRIKCTVNTSVGSVRHGKSENHQMNLHSPDERLNTDTFHASVRHLLPGGAHRTIKIDAAASFFDHVHFEVFSTAV